MIESIVLKATEDADERALRLLKERWSFFTKELTIYYASFLFVFLVGGYCCFVIIRHGPVAAESRAVFPLLTTLFGGVLGVLVGKGAK